MIWTGIGFFSAGFTMGAFTLSGGATLMAVIDDSQVGNRQKSATYLKWMSTGFRGGIVAAVVAVVFMILGDWPTGVVQWIVAIGIFIAGMVAVPTTLEWALARTEAQ